MFEDDIEMTDEMTDQIDFYVDQLPNGALLLEATKDDLEASVKLIEEQEARIEMAKRRVEWVREALENLPPGYYDE